MNAIELTHYSKSYGNHVIFKDFSFTVQANEMVAVTGESGIGKSTLLNSLSLIENFDEGQYFLFGSPAPRCNTREANRIIREKISYLFQNFALVDHYSVNENLMMALKYTKMSNQEKYDRIHEALSQISLQEFIDKKVFTLSGGQQQKIALIRASLKPSELLLADEPTGSLDEKNREIILKQLHVLHALGKTIILVTHDPYVADSCQRKVVIK